MASRIAEKRAPRSHFPTPLSAPHVARPSGKSGARIAEQSSGCERRALSAKGIARTGRPIYPRATPLPTTKPARPIGAGSVRACGVSRHRLTRPGLLCVSSMLLGAGSPSEKSNGSYTLPPCGDPHANGSQIKFGTSGPRCPRNPKMLREPEANQTLGSDRRRPGIPPDRRSRHLAPSARAHIKGVVSDGRRLNARGSSGAASGAQVV
jgi:hypothetical protein